MEKKYTFSVNDIQDVTTDDSAEFAIARIAVLSTKRNSHKVNITRDILMRDGSSVLGKWVIADFDGTDVTTHTNNTHIIGIVPTDESALSFVDNEDGTTTITYEAYRRPVVIKVVIPVDGIMYRFGYLDYTGKPAVPLYMEKFNPLWEQAMLYGRNPEYQAYARTYNFSGQGLVESNAVVNGESFIVRNENGKLVVEVKEGATLDISELIEITGMLGGFAVAGKPSAEAGSNVAAVLTYKNADVSELSYVLDIDGQHIMWAEKFKYESAAQAAAEFKVAMEAAFGGAFSNWSGNANIFKLFTESDEWDWVLDYWTAVNTNEYDGKKNADMFQALKNGDTSIDPYFIAVEANSFSKLTESAVYSSALKSANYGNADVQEAIWDFMPAPEPYKFESFDLFVAEFIQDYGTWAAEFCAANGKTFVTLVDGVPTFSGDGKPIDRTTWSGAMENVVGNANWKYTSFFEDERFAEKWGWLYEYLYNLEFPIDVIDVYKNIVNICNMDFSKYTFFVIKCYPKGNVSKVDLLSLRNGNFSELKMTKNGKRICLNCYDVWEYEKNNDNFLVKFSMNSSKNNVSYEVSGVDGKVVDSYTLGLLKSDINFYSLKIVMENIFIF